jgi:hypothetical protein
VQATSPRNKRHALLNLLANAIDLRFAVALAGDMRFIVPMPDADSTFTILLTILLPVMLILLFGLLLVTIRVASRLRRIEQRLIDTLGPMEEAVPIKRENLPREPSEFEAFLLEDGKRRLLTKREQSAAFREWRRLRGKTWNSGEKSES